MDKVLVFSRLLKTHWNDLSREVFGEVNDESLREKVSVNLNTFMSYFSNNVIAQYNIICDETNNAPYVIDNNNFFANIFANIDGVEHKFALGIGSQGPFVYMSV